MSKLIHVVGVVFFDRNDAEEVGGMLGRGVAAEFGHNVGWGDIIFSADLLEAGQQGASKRGIVKLEIKREPYRNPATDIIDMEMGVLLA